MRESEKLSQESWNVKCLSWIWVLVKLKGSVFRLTWYKRLKLAFHSNIFDRLAAKILE